MDEQRVRPEPENELSRLSRHYRPALMAYFLRRAASHAEAEDLTQEVFVRLATIDLGQLKSRDGYVFHVAANLLRDRGRRNKVRADHRARVSLEDEAGIDTLDPARFSADRESLALVERGLRELPERTRTIFVLYRLENVDKRAIAEAFGISGSAVDKHLFRAMAHLMDRLGKDA
ncbi:RNA polymerase sigma factor [Luteimonas suaedae]|uniref:RNA polymerase sigma factor n=1 Tax=Luteimonas suaedae TaxID=2605430 RepID=UPI001CA7C08B|nr:sigma-70 family RNA polymerase sigma factor [Luteimonas suaedae]